ncbi:hypothetical protein, partial [Marisediminitalea sp.]|uniref:hypothetical protein n=1 Tax=Marisediminitalea sp. TaxID=2662268 RepID=UPI0035180DF5
MDLGSTVDSDAANVGRTVVAEGVVGRDIVLARATEQHNSVVDCRSRNTTGRLADKVVTRDDVRDVLAIVAVERRRAETL